MSNILTKEKNNKGTVKFPWFYYSIFMTVCLGARVFFGGRAVKTEAFKEAKKQGPMLVLCNHASAFDFVFFTPPFLGKKVSFVVAENLLYSTPILAKLIRAAREITKKQYVVDLGCVRKIKKYMDSGISVALCPEGQSSNSGKSGLIPQANGKLMKFLGYPVAVCNTSGAGLTRPKWGYTGRRGKVVTKCDLLYTAEQVKELSSEELHAGLVKALEFNEHKYQIENGVIFKGRKYAEGLERVLYRCPKCGAEFTQVTEGHLLTCQSCGNQVHYGNDGRLTPIGDSSVCPERVDIWYDQERECVKEEVKSDDFVLEHPSALFIEKPEICNYRYVTSGTVRMDKEKIVFTSNSDVRPKNMVSEFGVSKFEFTLDENGETEPVEEEFKRVEFLLKNMESVDPNPGNALELYDSKHAYRIVFTETKASTKYALAVEEIYKQRK